MFAYCVNHLSSLKARLVSEHFGGNKFKILKGGHMINYGKHLSVRLFCRMYLSRETSVDCCSRSLRLKRLKSAVTWAFALFYCVVIVSLPVS